MHSIEWRHTTLYPRTGYSDQFLKISMYHGLIPVNGVPVMYGYVNGVPVMYGRGLNETPKEETNESLIFSIQ